jgi:hypothetical protein
MKEYREECALMSMVQWLDEHCNEEYRSDKKKNPTLLYWRIGTYKDAGYTAKFFDVLQWWKLVGEIKYKELAVVATIFLGKSTHNGFQERVFSRGTYSDTKLRKRLKENNFEMSVLNAFNGRKVDEIKERLKQEPDWKIEKDNSCVPNKEQAKEVITFFKEKLEDDDVIILETETAKPKDDDTISVGSDINGLNWDEDDDDQSLEDFLKSKAYFEEREPE